MLKIKCTRCDTESTVNMYFYNPEIYVREDPSLMERDYTARATGRAICPTCGTEMIEHFSCPITRSDVIDLALRREVHV